MFSFFLSFFLFFLFFLPAPPPSPSSDESSVVWTDTDDTVETEDEVLSQLQGIMHADDQEVQPNPSTELADT